MENSQGRTVRIWAVQEKEGAVKRVTTSYTLWRTRAQAIEGYCKKTGKSWAQLKKEGATLVRGSVVVYDKPTRLPPEAI